MNPDTTAAAERVRRIKNGEEYHCVYGIEPINYNRFKADEHTLADAYLAQSPAYEQQAAEIAELRAKVRSLESETEDARLLLGNGWQQVIEVARGEPGVEAALHMQLTKLAGDVSCLEGDLEDLRARTQAFDDERPVDEATIREVYKDYEITTLHYRQGGKQLRIDCKDYSFSFAVMSDGGVFYGPHKIKTVGQLTHLLAALGGDK